MKYRTPGEPSYLTLVKTPSYVRDEFYSREGVRIEGITGIPLVEEPGSYYVYRSLLWVEEYIQGSGRNPCEYDFSGMHQCWHDQNRIRVRNLETNKWFEIPRSLLGKVVPSRPLTEEYPVHGMTTECVEFTTVGGILYILIRWYPGGFTLISHR